RDAIAVSSCSDTQKSVAATDTAAACTVMRRALYLIDHHTHHLKQLFSKSIALSEYFKNEAFYQDRLRRRVKACNDNRINLHCVGLCATKSERVAYVLETLGFMHTTINLCDEFFSSDPHYRISTMVHEFGRLEGINRDEGWNTSDIFLWDGIFRTLGDLQNYQYIVNMP
ncbi:hypothetical protein K2X33_03800, partial [bacterium]|nr:hypothetical protein [bacterium]